MEQSNIRVSKFTAGIAVTVLLAVLGQGAAYLRWSGQVSEQIRSLQVELSDVKNRLENGTQMRYTSADAIKDRTAIEKRLESIEDRLVRIESLHVKQ